MCLVCLVSCLFRLFVLFVFVESFTSPLSLLPMSAFFAKVFDKATEGVIRTSDTIQGKLSPLLFFIVGFISCDGVLSDGTGTGMGTMILGWGMVFERGEYRANMLAYMLK